MLELDLIHTLAFAGVMIFVGYGICRAIPVLSRYNVPAPVVGGLLVAVSILLAKRWGVEIVKFDTALQTPLMIAFFTSIGFSASLSLLRVGGIQVGTFLLASTVFAVVQNIVGAAVAVPFGLHPLFGVMCGSVTLTGGPATGLAFAPLFEKAGVTGADSLAIAAAMVGIISGGLIGGPLATFLIERKKLRTRHTNPVDTERLSPVVEIETEERPAAVPVNEDEESYSFLKNIVAVLVAMWIGSWVSGWFESQGLTLPAYIGAMLVAAVIRNVDDVTKLFGLSQRMIGGIGDVALSLFIVLALMTLKLWVLARLAVPLLVILAVQVAVIAAVCLWPMFQLFGRDYDSAVMSGGFCGFMLGTTANAMAIMKALVERYGPSPRAFLVVPIVGAFFIDFTNALIIVACLNLFK